MRVPPIVQSERAECGLAALTMIANYHGHALDLLSMRRQFPRAVPTLNSLIGIAAELGLAVRPLRLSIPDLPRLALPAIVHWEFDHFVVVVRVGRRRIVVNDPAVGRRTLSHRDFARGFTGVAVEFACSPEFVAQVASSRPSILGLWRSFSGLGRYFALLLCLLATTQVLALVPPIATQLLIDEVVLGHDRAWLHRILAGIALVMLATLLIDALRRHVGIYVGMKIGIDSASIIVKHLFNLPVATVSKRSVGDLMSRVDSLKPVQAAMTETFLKAVVQSSVLLTTMTLMFVYSVKLSLVSLSALAIVGLIQVASLPRLRGYTMNAVLDSARAKNSLVESLRGYTSVTALGLATQRLAHWQQGFSGATNAETQRQQVAMLASTGQGVVNVFEHVLFLLVGLTGVLEKQLTLGVLFAFIGLRGRIQAAAVELVGATRDLYLVRPHLERVGEIVAEEGEPPAEAVSARKRLGGEISCIDLYYGYPGLPLLLQGFHARIEAGESVAICGPSGAGKSTLLHLLAGLLSADRGALEYDGIEIALWDRNELRSQLGIVLQSDRLFEGSIADNISCFDTAADIGRIREAAEIAHIWEEINALPMGLHTRLGAAGNGMSGGQQQRVLLARALYRLPKVLLLDEATCHLDHPTEKRVVENLDVLGVTIVSVAHRSNAIAQASRTISLAPDMAFEP